MVRSAYHMVMEYMARATTLGWKEGPSSIGNGQNVEKVVECGGTRSGETPWIENMPWHFSNKG